jgi:hypothetical protein
MAKITVTINVLLAVSDIWNLVDLSIVKGFNGDGNNNRHTGYGAGFREVAFKGGSLK